MNRFDINTCLFVHIVNLHLINLEEIEGMWLNMSWIHFMSENRTISNEPTLIMNRIVVDMNRCTSNGDTNWVFTNRCSHFCRVQFENVFFLSFRDVICCPLKPTTLQKPPLFIFHCAKAENSHDRKLLLLSDIRKTELHRSWHFGVTTPQSLPVVFFIFYVCAMMSKVPEK